MRLPICIDGEKQGEITIEQRGQWIVADARLADVGRVVRLRLYGEGEYYLGVPLPEGNELRLVKKLSPAEAKRLPRHPRCAAEHPPAPAARGAGPREESRVLWLGGKPHFF